MTMPMLLWFLSAAAFSLVVALDALTQTMLPLLSFSFVCDPALTSHFCSTFHVFLKYSISDRVRCRVELISPSDAITTFYWIRREKNQLRKRCWVWNHESSLSNRFQYQCISCSNHKLLFNFSFPQTEEEAISSHPARCSHHQQQNI